MLRGLHNPLCLTRLAFRSTKGENGFQFKIFVQTVDNVPVNSKTACTSPPPLLGTNSPVCCQFRACLHGGGVAQVGEVTRLGGVNRQSM